MRQVLLALLMLGKMAQPGEIARDIGPVVLHQATPEYTQEARDHRFQGDVNISAVVNEDGLLTDITLKQQLPYHLEEKARECAGKWRFKPATHDTHPVPSRVAMVLHFRLP